MEIQRNGSNIITPNEQDNVLIHPLLEPPFEEIINALTTGLPRYFEYVDVTLTTCPNLTLQPYNLAAKGLRGNEMIVRCSSNINRVVYDLQDSQDSPETYSRNILLTGERPLWDLRETMALWTRKIPPSFSFLIGGGYALKPVYPFNGMLIMNATHSAPMDYNNESSVVFKDTNSMKMETLRNPEHMMCSIDGNFFMSEGEEGDVLKICVKRRKPVSSPPRLNIIQMIRNILSEHFFYANNYMGLGGILVVKKGKIKHQVFCNDVDVNALRPDNFPFFWNISHSEIPKKTPFLIGLGTMLTQPREEFEPTVYDSSDNFYNFSSNEDGGLFWNDESSDDESSDVESSNVEYEVYFNIAKQHYCPLAIFKEEETHTQPRRRRRNMRR